MRIKRMVAALLACTMMATLTIPCYAAEVAEDEVTSTEDTVSATAEETEEARVTVSWEELLDELSDGDDEDTTDDTAAEETILTGTVTVDSYLNLRSGAGTDYDVLGQLPSGTQVTVIGEEDGWYQVTVSELTGYVYSDFLDVVETSIDADTEDSDELDTALLLMLFSLMLQNSDEDADTSSALTPEGNLTLVDNIEDSTSGKQFITVVTKSGNYFYLIIDEDDDGESTVHFLNQVDEADLLALMDDEDVEEYTASQETETEPVTEPVEDELETTGDESEVEATESEEAEVEASSSGSMMPMIVLVLVLFGGGGGFLYLQTKKKKQTQQKPDPDADYTGEDDEELELPDEDSYDDEGSYTDTDEEFDSDDDGFIDDGPV
ncbi:MAG: DUF4366 domain-containing protein [Clostridiales bacterium]|nr:DUF4366 domain-containing protein [Clostridiales bacterium]